jgi:ATP-dependent DNA ligase
MASVHITVHDYRTIGGGELQGQRYVFPLVQTTGGTWRVSCGLSVEILAVYFEPGSALPPGTIADIEVESTTTLGNRRPTAKSYVTAGKNIGKANQTNAWCQALRDALSRHNKQAARAGPLATAKPLFFPMLAQVYDEAKAEYPGWVSAKMDGLRAVVTSVDGQPRIYSRALREYPCWRICEELTAMLAANPTVYLDGEIYAHGTPLQQIASAAKAPGGGQASVALLKYHCYDMFTVVDGTVTAEPFGQRLAKLRTLFAQWGLPSEHVALCEHVMVQSKAAAEAEYQRWLHEGYEGAMIRWNHAYDSRPNNYHSQSMVKLKPLLDAEFELVGWDVAVVGKAAGSLMLEFATEGAKRFWVTPAMPDAARKRLALAMPTDWPKWQGRRLTVYYAGMSVDGVPLQGRTKMVGRFD